MDRVRDMVRGIRVKEGYLSGQRKPSRQMTRRFAASALVVAMNPWPFSVPAA